MLSGVSDIPDRPKTYCSFRGREPKQRHLCRKKKFGNQIQVLKKTAGVGLRSPGGDTLVFLPDPQLLF